MLEPTKVKIAVRMKDHSRRLYTVDDVGMAVEQMRAATLSEVPQAAAILIGLPAPEPILQLA
mgnify:FL=1